MAAGYVPSSPLSTLYSNTTAGTPASPDAVDGAVQAIVTTVNENFDFAAGLISAGTLSKLGIINVKDYGVEGDGTTDDYTDLNNLITTTINGAEATILFPKGTYKISSNITIPSNITLVLTKGAMLSPDSGKTITINGPIEAGLWQIFTGSGTIAGSMKVEGVFPQWWGAVGDDSTDNSTALQKAIDNRILNGGVLCVPPGIYRHSATLTVNDDVHINGLSEKGNSTRGVYFKYTGTGTAWKLGKYDGNWMYSLKLSGVRIGAATSADVAIEVDRLSESDFADIHFNGAFSTVMLIRGLTISSIRDCDFSTIGMGIHFDANASTKENTSNTIERCNFYANTVAAIKINKALSLRLHNNWFEQSPIGIWIDNNSTEGFASVNHLVAFNNDFTLVSTAETRALKITNSVNANQIIVTNLKFISNRCYMGAANNSDYAIETNYTANTHAGSSVTGIVRDNELWGVDLAGVYSDTQKTMFTVENNDCKSGFGSSVVAQTAGSGKYLGFSHLPGFDYNEVLGYSLKLGGTLTNSLAAGMIRYSSSNNAVMFVKSDLTEVRLGSYVSVPASATATGSVGQWSADASFIYVCHATNTWKRAAIAAW